MLNQPLHYRQCIHLKLFETFSSYLTTHILSFKINFEKNNKLYNHYIQQYTINLEKAQFIGRYLLHDNEMTSHLLYLPKRSKVGKANKNATSLIYH